MPICNSLLGAVMTETRETQHWRVKDGITGKHFGRLTAIRFVGRTKNGTAIWLFHCDCGGSIEMTKASAAKPNASCGCQKEKGRNFKHGHTSERTGRTKEYIAWGTMKTRCLDPKSSNYSKYGGAGITIEDPAWIVSFESFLRDMGPCPDDCNSVDRWDNARGYFKENAHWATPEQQANNRTSNIIVTVNGITETLTQSVSSVWYQLHHCKSAASTRTFARTDPANARRSSPFS